MFVWALTKENHFLQREIICTFVNFPKSKMIHQLLGVVTSEEAAALVKELEVKIQHPTFNTPFVYRLEQVRQIQ